MMGENYLFPHPLSIPIKEEERGEGGETSGAISYPDQMIFAGKFFRLKNLKLAPFYTAYFRN